MNEFGHDTLKSRKPASGKLKSTLLASAALAGFVLAAPIAAHAQAAFQGQGAPPPSGEPVLGGKPSAPTNTATAPTGTAPTGTAPVTAQPAAAPAAQPMAAPSEVNLTPSPIQQMGQTLYNEGIYLNSRYLGEFADNPVGGQRQGADYAGELNLGATFDMEKLAGIEGGAFHVLFTQRHGRANSFQDINNSISTQEIYGGGQTLQLTILTYEQKLFNNMLDVQFGRTDLGDSFDVSPFYCDFQSNALCGNPPDMGKILSTPFYPVAVWGGRVLVTPTPNIYLKFGAYQSDPTLNPDAHHGFDWGTQGSNGFLVPIEGGYKFTTPGAVAANQYDVGVIFDRTHYSTTTPFGVPFYSPGTQYGRTAIYAQGQQMVFQPYANKPQGVYLFAEGMVGVSGSKQVSNFQAEGGMIWQGPFASRPNDNIGLAVSGVHYNNRYLNALYDTRIAEGGANEFPARNLIMTEVHYAVQVNKWLNLMPNFQYVINPDGTGFSSYSTHNLKDAAVFGVQVYIDLPSLFGIPTKS